MHTPARWAAARAARSRGGCPRSPPGPARAHAEIRVRGPQGPRRRGERGYLAVDEHHRLVLRVDAAVHDGAVPVALGVGFEPLLVVAGPGHVAALRGRDAPIGKAGKVRPEAPRRRRRPQVHEGKARVRSGAKVHGQVEEVNVAAEAARVQQLQQPAARQLPGDVPHHHGSRPAVAATAPCAGARCGRGVARALLLLVWCQRRLAQRHGGRQQPRRVGPGRRLGGSAAGHGRRGSLVNDVDVQESPLHNDAKWQRRHGRAGTRSNPRNI
mmetsp:Transcript_20571/g.58279  ORF Transcript_20571/g.58279 Transcript_20571/m.58279 type:complete len:269 (-) Transcript_20571:28-834(-)